MHERIMKERRELCKRSTKKKFSKLNRQQEILREKFKAFKWFFHEFPTVHKVFLLLGLHLLPPSSWISNCFPHWLYMTSCSNRSRCVAEWNWIEINMWVSQWEEERKGLDNDVEFQFENWKFEQIFKFKSMSNSESKLFLEFQTMIARLCISCNVDWI